jgi:cell fate regulator YaaT (PSP1 superfamily)
MGCSTCSTKTTDGKSAGCKNNGSCDTGGCNKLNIYNWLSNMELPSGQDPFNIIEVRFKGSRKEFFKLEDNMSFKVNDMVAVEGSPGHDIGKVSIVGELVKLQLKKKGVKENSDEIKKVYRPARLMDLEKYEEAKAAEENTMYRARTIALQLKLSMKLSDVEYQGDMKKATFYYTADERVDFRELIKRLAEEFKVRIEMRQIGMRQEASRLGGIGSCGRELCCSTWLTDFKSVTTGAARYQNLALNPLKLAGQCGKLKCCLNYELDSYLDALRDLPDSNTYLKTIKGTAVHRKTDIFKRLMWYSYSNKLSTTETSAQFRESEDWVAIPVERVKEIIALNKKDVKPSDLLKQSDVPKEKVIGYDDVVGQDSITRMDNKPKPKKFKKRRSPQAGTTPPNTNPSNPNPNPGIKK